MECTTGAQLLIALNDHHLALYVDQNTPAAKMMIRQDWAYNH
jgi:hypothetical protein